MRYYKGRATQAQVPFSCVVLTFSGKRVEKTEREKGESVRTASREENGKRTNKQRGVTANMQLPWLFFVGVHVREERKRERERKRRGRERTSENGARSRGGGPGPGRPPRSPI